MCATPCGSWVPAHRRSWSRPRWPTGCSTSPESVVRRSLGDDLAHPILAAAQPAVSAPIGRPSGWRSADGAKIAQLGDRRDARAARYSDPLPTARRPLGTWPGRGDEVSLAIGWRGEEGPGALLAPASRYGGA